MMGPDTAPTPEEAEAAGGLSFLSGTPCTAPDYGKESLRAKWRIGWRKAQAKSDVTFTAADLRAEGDADDVVGLKTGVDGRHEPLTRAEAAAFLEAADAARAKRLADMPTEQDAIHAMFEAWQRLTELGWREAVCCPKDGSSFDVIEAGSTGIHRCFYSCEWPYGVTDAGAVDLSKPPRPILFRLDPEAEAARKAKMEAARAAYLANRERDNDAD